MKMHAGSYEAHPYNSTVHVATTRKALIRLMRSEKFKCSESEIDNACTAAGYAMQSGGQYILAVLDGKVRTLVHEAVHVASEILIRAGIKPMSNSQESLAYLVDDLVGRITKEK